MIQKQYATTRFFFPLTEIDLDGAFDGHAKLAATLCLFHLFRCVEFLTNSFFESNNVLTAFAARNRHFDGTQPFVFIKIIDFKSCEYRQATQRNWKYVSAVTMFKQSPPIR
jgi:hypothetical protein